MVHLELPSPCDPFNLSFYFSTLAFWFAWAGGFLDVVVSHILSAASNQPTECLHIFPIKRLVMSLSKWTLFVQRCLSQRVDGEEFQELAELLNEKHRVSAKALVKVLLQCRRTFCPTEDPLIPLYLHAIVALGLAQISDVLLLLVKSWNQIDYREFEEKQPGAMSRADAAIVLDLATGITSNNIPQNPESTRISLVLASRWLSALVKWFSEQASQTTIHPVVALVEAVGLFVAALASSDHGMTLLTDKDVKGEFNTLLFIRRH